MEIDEHALNRVIAGDLEPDDSRAAQGVAHLDQLLGWPSAWCWASETRRFFASIRPDAGGRKSSKSTLNSWHGAAG
ncbi:hypothetical protein O4H66_23770 [Comamonadaceae bacterium G21597-S1]|nr:hypothetical protein [Comamonadaceae bacterium G21597-S1]